MGFMSSEFLRTLKKTISLYKKLSVCNNNSSKSLQNSGTGNSMKVCKVSTAYKKLSKNLAGWNLE